MKTLKQTLTMKAKDEGAQAAVEGGGQVGSEGSKARGEGGADEGVEAGGREERGEQPEGQAVAQRVCCEALEGPLS